MLFKLIEGSPRGIHQTAAAAYLIKGGRFFGREHQHLRGAASDSETAGDTRECKFQWSCADARIDSRGDKSG
jgi:hypothetical protein